MKKTIYKLSMILALMSFALTAHASTVAQYPWAETLQKIMDSLSGPVAYSCAGIAIVLAGLSMAFLDLSGGAKKFVQAALGISIAFGVTTIMAAMFTFQGALII
jgi:type IV secretion system protein TrbC